MEAETGQIPAEQVRTPQHSDSSCESLDNWNAGERRVRAERAFPLMLGHLNAGTLSRRMQQTLLKYINEQDVSWMTDDLSFLSTHTIRLAECGMARNVNAYVLGYQSAYFRGIFKYTESRTIDIRLDWLSPIAPCILAAVDATELSGCHVTITDENCLHMFLAADFIMCEQLRSRCLRHLCLRCEQDCGTALATWGFAHSLSLSELISASLKPLLRGFTAIRLTRDFLDLDADALREILGHRMLNCASELQVLETVGHWLRHEPSAQAQLRKSQLEPLLCCARVSLLQPEQLKAALNLPAAVECADYQEYLRVYPRPTAFSARHNLRLTRSDRPRRPHQVVLVLCGHSMRTAAKRESLATCLVYNPRADAWDRRLPDRRPLADPSDARLSQLPLLAVDERTGQAARFCCLSAGDRLYLIGGSWLGTAHRLVLCFDRQKPDLGWVETTQLTQRRARHCCAAVEGFVYAVGGVTSSDGEPSASVERMALSGDTANFWSAVAPMQRPRSEAAAVQHRGRLLVVGGFDGKAHLDSAEVYCPTNAVWTALSGRGLCERRSDLGVVACGGAVYALCGRNARGWRRSVERWEEGRGWKALCKIATRRSSFGCAVVDGRIFLFGGVNANGHVESTEWLDLSQQPPVCGEGRQMPLSEGSFGTCLLDVDMEDFAGS